MVLSRVRSNQDMNDDKQDDLPVSDTDRQIYDYLDEMLHDPAAGETVSIQPELGLVVPDNVAQFDVSKKKTTPAPSTQAAPSRPVQPAQAKTLSLIDRPALLSESLLQMPEEQAPEEPEPKAVPKEDAPPQTPPESELEPEPEIEPEEIVVPGLETESGGQWCENGRPEWAQSRFECLIFTVNGLKLAVPLVLLGSIHQIDRRFNALPGQYDWFLGILQTPNAGNIKVLDTGLCVMPERYDPASRDSLAYVITIHGYSWGLACHQVEKSITLEPDQVKWRTQRGKRPWLAGTVLEYMCSLVDTDGFQEIISQAEQSQ